MQGGAGAGIWGGAELAGADVAGAYARLDISLLDQEIYPHVGKLLRGLGRECGRRRGKPHHRLLLNIAIKHRCEHSEHLGERGGDRLGRSDVSGGR